MVKTNLQYQLTNFIGREQDLTAVKQLLTSSRLVTLTGVGGCGKTRLAIQVANDLHETYSEGVWLVDLAPVREPELVPQFVAQTLGLGLLSDVPVPELLCRFLVSKRLLLVLDNCEHLRDACAQLAGTLLSRTPEVRILATSRAVLGAAGETLYPLSGMVWPDDASVSEAGRFPPLDLPQLSTYDAIHLFVDRARACALNFSLTAENAHAVVEICRRLDGLPLAIELVSARVNILTVHEIADRLAGSQEERFALHLPGPQSGSDPRHHSLYEAIEWSHALLSPDEKILFRRLAAFTAGFTLDTVEAVCMDSTLATLKPMDGISSLFSKSLVTADTLGRTQARYRLLETIREYALEKLDAAGEKADLYDRHLQFFLTHAEEAAPRMGDSFQQFWLNWLDGEQDNLRAALDWALESSRIEEGLRLACTLVRYWEIRSLNRESLSWFERLLARAGEDVAPAVHANACTFSSFVSMFLGNASAALRYGRKAVDIAELAASAESSDAEAIRAFALSGLAAGARAAGDYLTSYELLKEVTQYYRETGNRFYLGMSLLAQGDVAIELGEFDEARTLLNETLVLAQEAGDIFRSAHSYNSLGDLARYEGKDAEALAAYQNSETLLRQLNDKHDLASVLCNQGRAHLRLGNYERAHTALDEGMAIQQAEQNRPGVIECLIGLATVAIRMGLPAEGVYLIAACEALGKQPARGVWPAKRMAYEEHLTYARENIGESAFEAGQSAGRAMTFDQAVDYAMHLPWKTVQDQRKLPNSLTKREREIVSLIGQGKTNSEIAVELTLSKRTVETHVSNILSKLRITRRAQILHWAMEHKMIRFAK